MMLARRRAAVRRGDGAHQAQDLEKIAGAFVDGADRRNGGGSQLDQQHVGAFGQLQDLGERSAAAVSDYKRLSQGGHREARSLHKWPEEARSYQLRDLILSVTTET